MSAGNDSKYAMRFIESREMAELSVFLSERNTGLYTLTGRLEAFDFSSVDEECCPDKVKQEALFCGIDIPKVLRRNRSNSMGSAPARRPLRRRSSSLGDLSEPESQKLFMSLISALNDNYPDYDFQGAKSHQFVVQDVSKVMRSVNGYLAEINDANSMLLTKLWQTIDLVANLQQCEIFSYAPSWDDDSFDGALWFFNFFFFNKETMRICYLTCVANSNLRIANRGELLNEDFEDYESSEPTPKKNKGLNKCKRIAEDEEEDGDEDDENYDDDDDEDDDAINTVMYRCDDEDEDEVNG